MVGIYWSVGFICGDLDKGLVFGQQSKRLSASNFSEYHSALFEPQHGRKYASKNEVRSYTAPPGLRVHHGHRSFYFPARLGRKGRFYEKFGSKV